MQPFHYVTTKLEIGAQAPFRILHVTDTHIARADADDDSRKQALARQRAAAFEGEVSRLHGTVFSGKRGLCQRNGGTFGSHGGSV